MASESIYFKPGLKDAHEELLPQFETILKSAAQPQSWCLDIGCGCGRVAFLLASTVRWVVGIDRKPERIAEARKRAELEGRENVRFLVADAESGSYVGLAPPGAFDLITANLCLTDVIIRRAVEALFGGGRLAITCFEKSQWQEAGLPIDHSYSESRLKAVLQAAGLEIESLEVFTRVIEFESFEQLVIQYLPQRIVDNWRENGRLRTIEENFKEGHRTLTESKIVFSALKPGRSE
ncbi:MAG TPA: class I SAM-dependent methyltransferase [Acidobacteriota bacterium]|nr:class I SAM-dependent methyltransferase [Acidobacteriota bacterium]